MNPNNTAAENCTYPFPPPPGQAPPPQPRRIRAKVSYKSPPPPPPPAGQDPIKNLTQQFNHTCFNATGDSFSCDILTWAYGGCLNSTFPQNATLQQRNGTCIACLFDENWDLPCDGSYQIQQARASLKNSTSQGPPPQADGPWWESDQVNQVIENDC